MHQMDSIFTTNGMSHGKKWLSAYKSSNISETGQDRTKITIEDQNQRLLIAIKGHYVPCSKNMCHGVSYFIFSFTSKQQNTAADVQLHVS